MMDLMSWIDLINFAVAIGGMMVVLMGLNLTLVTPYMERWNRRFFLVLFTLLTAYISADLIEQVSLVLLGTGFGMLSRLGIFFESLFSSLLLPLLTLYVVHCTGEDQKKSPALYLSCGLWLIYLGLLILTQFTTFIYYITQDNVYHRGPWYPLLLIPTALLQLLNLIVMLRRRSQLSVKQRTALEAYLLLPLACMLLQMVSYGLLLIVIGTSISAMFMFVFILSDQTDHYVKAREELAKERAQVSVLQMRPHFIHNTLTSIYFLCGQDPKKAQQVILDFNSYLRRNFAAIAKEGTIPFSEELEHTRAYLAVEQVRFEGKLFVEFDTPHMNFRLPPLTLQPIVENAVKHGVDPELEPLYISIHTRDTAEGSEIIVEDNGPGLNEDSPTAGNRIALTNIRERLQLTCKGTIELKNREGGGTVVTISVPSSSPD